jgi:hypothetical protein
LIYKGFAQSFELLNQKPADIDSKRGEQHKLVKVRVRKIEITPLSQRYCREETGYKTKKFGFLNINPENLICAYKVSSKQDPKVKNITKNPLFALLRHSLQTHLLESEN